MAIINPMYHDKTNITYFLGIPFVLWVDVLYGYFP